MRTVYLVICNAGTEQEFRCLAHFKSFEEALEYLVSLKAKLSKSKLSIHKFQEVNLDEQPQT